MDQTEDPAEAVFFLVDEVPPGSVVTYGSVAKVLELNPRHVARIMATDPEASVVPWHRVVGAGGEIKAGPQRKRQIDRLRSEGLVITANRIQHFPDHEFGL